MDQCTQNYECLVVDNTSQSAKLEDCVFWYKAEIHPDFKIGDPEFWQHSANFYRDKEEEDMNQYDPSQGRRLKGPEINVQKRF
jgi:hypothetical protein